MAPYKASLCLATTPDYVLPGANTHDFLMYTGNPDQSMLIGISNQSTLMKIDGEGNVAFSGNISFSNQLLFNGFIITQRNSTAINNLTSSTGGNLVGFERNSEGNIIISMSDTGNSINFRRGFSNLAVLTSNAFLGIGKSNPQYALDVLGSMNMTGALYQNGALYQSSRWSVNSSNIYILSSNVGIGKSNPQYALDVVGSMNMTGALFQNGALYQASRWSVNSSNIYILNSNVGIKTTNPNHELDVNGNINYNGNLLKDGVSYNMTPSNIITSNITCKTLNVQEFIYDFNLTTNITQLQVNSNDSATNPGYTWSNNSNTGMYHVSHNTIGFSTNGVTVVTMSSNYAVDVYGDLNLRGALRSNGNLINFTDTTTSNVAYAASNMAFPMSNMAFPMSNMAYTMSNMAFPMSNMAFPMSNMAYTTSNIARATSNMAFPMSNVAYPTSNMAFPMSNVAYATSNMAFPMSNVAYPTSNMAFPMSNVAYPTSNVAYWSSNNLLPKTGGSISGQLTSTVTTGTAPFAITSQTLNTNLNADLLDGQHGTFYQNALNINSGTLGVTYGGTGSSNLISNKVLVGNGTGSILQPANLDWNNATSTLDVTGNINYNGSISRNGVSYNMTPSNIITSNVTCENLNITGLNFNVTILAFSNILCSSNDSSNAPSYSWEGNIKTGMYHHDCNIIGFTSGGANKMLIGSNITVLSSIIPNANEEFDLGNSNMRFRDLYMSGNTIYMSSNYSIGTDPVADTFTLIDRRSMQPARIYAKELILPGSNNQQKIMRVDATAGNLKFFNKNISTGIEIEESIGGNITWITLTLLFNYAVVTTDGFDGYGLKCTKDIQGRVTLQGAVTGASATSSIPTQLPIGYRPARTVIMCIVTKTGTTYSNTYINITSDGNVNVPSNIYTQQFFFDGISFMTSK